MSWREKSSSRGDSLLSGPFVNQVRASYQIEMVLMIDLGCLVVRHDDTSEASTGLVVKCCLFVVGIAAHGCTLLLERCGDDARR